MGMKKTFVVKAVAAAVPVMCAIAARADVFTNITAVVRASNASTVKLENGTCKAPWYPIWKAFDGMIASPDWNGNAQVSEKPTEDTPVIVYYSIGEDFSPGSRFTVTAFRFYSAFNIPARSIGRVRLEVSENGKDGWCVLGENGFDVELGSLTEKVCTPFTVTIPASARRDGRHYRFVITENLGYEGDPEKTDDPSLWISELELLGEIHEPLNLVWNGGEGGTWDSTAQNWNAEGGAAASWTSRSRAVIGDSSVVISGEAEVSELMLTNTLAAQTVSGGTLAMRIPGRISARDGDVISSAFSCGEVSTNLFECGDAAGYPPVDANATTTGVDAVFFSDSRVSEITGVPEESDNYRVYFSSTENGYYPSYPMFFRIEDFGLSFQVHTHGGREQYIDGEKFVLWQEEDNVKGRVCWSKFNNASGISEPYDFEALTASWAYHVLPKDGRQGYANNGVRNLRVITDVSSALTVDCGGKVVLSTGTFLPRTSDKKTGTAVTYIEDDTLATIGDFVDADGFYYAQNRGSAKPFFTVRTPEMITVQFQFEGPSFNHCIKVEFTQNGRNVDVRAVYAKSGSKVNAPIGTDFDDPALGNKVWAGDLGKGDASGGIIIKDIVVKRAGRVHLDGAFCADRSVAVHRGVLELGAPELALGQRFSGDGSLAFAPAADSQSVSFSGYCGCEGGLELSGATTVTVVRTGAFAAGLPVSFNGNGASLAFAAGTDNSVGTVEFAGENSLSVGDDASISMDSVAFTEDAVVNLVADDALGAQAVRVGTTRCLTKDQLARFRVNGRPVRRQTDEGWLDLHRYGLRITVQ